MDFAELINSVPIWGVFVLTMALCVTLVEVGAAYSRAALRKSAKDPDGPDPGWLASAAIAATDVMSVEARPQSSPPSHRSCPLSLTRRFSDLVHSGPG